MLTRLKVSGFKNLVDVDIRFGPFTCIAGPNGVGKSNLFDAIRLLSGLAEKSLIEAALSIRDEEGKSTDLRSLFHKYGKNIDSRMTFEADMIISPEGKDDFGRAAKASTTFLRYSLTLAYREDNDRATRGELEIVSENLEHIKKGDASKELLFPHEKKTWRDSAIQGRRTGKFISTETNDAQAKIKLHMDGGTGGRPQSFLAAASNRTILSSSNSSDSQTAWLAKQEMLSWRQLHLEPSSLRKPDTFLATPRLGEDGAHLPATLHKLARRKNGASQQVDEDAVYAQAANRLAELIGDVEKLWVSPDHVRELYILKLKEKNGTELDARSLSDGTLRFLALTVLEMDPDERGLLCLEEPENGIHPERIPAMLALLKDIAVDVHEKVGSDNPLRQVIVNTHSPAVVQQIDDGSLLVAEIKEAIHDGIRFNRTVFSCLPGTWRITRDPNRDRVSVCSKGRLMAYLNPAVASDETTDVDEDPKQSKEKTKRVIDRKDLYDNSFFDPADCPVPV